MVNIDEPVKEDMASTSVTTNGSITLNTPIDKEKLRIMIKEYRQELNRQNERGITYLEQEYLLEFDDSSSGNTFGSVAEAFLRNNKALEENMREELYTFMCDVITKEQKEQLEFAPHKYIAPIFDECIKLIFDVEKEIKAKSN